MPIPQDAFPQPSDPPSRKVAPAPEWLGAAGLSLVLHFILFALLAWQWQPAPAKAPSNAPVLITQLIAAPVPKPAPLVAPAPTVPAPPQPVEPVQQPTPPKPVEDATLARKRQQEQQQQAIKQRQQQIQQQQAEQLAQEQAERERLAALAAAEAQRAQALAAQQAAQWAANNHDYAPLNKPTPDYPEQALNRGVEGDCTVEYTVTANGSVDDPRIVGDCHPLFIRASLNAAKAFRYQPRRVEGQAQAVANVRNTFHYRIDQQP